MPEVTTRAGTLMEFCLVLVAESSIFSNDLKTIIAIFGCDVMGEQ